MPETTFKQKSALIAFGLLLGIILLEVGLRIGGFVLLHLQERANLASLEEKGEFVILCLGESTTALGGQDSYPRQLEDVLNERDAGIKFSVINKGIVATNTTTIASLLEKNLDEYHPDMVLTMIGINDSHREISLKDARPGKFQLFLKNFRVYKLARLLREHIVLTLRDIYSISTSKKENELIGVHSELEPATVFSEEETRLQQITRKNPDDPRPYIELGDLLKDRGRLDAAESFYQKVKDIAPELIEDRYKKLTCLYFNRGEFKQCVRVGEKAIEAGDGRISPIFGNRLTCAYLHIQKTEEAERLCWTRLKLNPRNASAWSHLGDVHRARNNWREAEKAYKKAVEFQPNNIAFTTLMFEYVKRDQFEKAEELGRTILSSQPNNIRMLGAMAFCYQAWGKQNLADEYYNKIALLQGNAFKAVTIRNYCKIKETLDKRGIRLVCFQYPTRSLEPLKKIFDGQEGPIFVDNENIFKNAVRDRDFKYYFWDCFGGDFGHCTRAGNRLLAENIADTLFATCFKDLGVSPKLFRKNTIETRAPSARDNLLDSADVVLSASSRNEEYQTVNKLADNNLGTYWHISLPEVGRPAWVIADFGRGNEKTVRSLGAFPRRDNPRQFFHKAEFFGSNNGEDWESVSEIIQAELPKTVNWKVWKFDNNQSYRYYRLLILNGHEESKFFSMAEMTISE